VLWKVHEGRDVVLNEDYLKNAPDQIKAILGYISAFAGSECWWQNDQPNADLTNLKCKLTWALGLGFQGSKEHKDFLHYWFRHDPKLSEFDDYNTVPYTATNQNTLDYLNVQKLSGDVYKIEYKTSWVNARDDRGGYEKHEAKFRVLSDQVILLSDALAQQGRY